MSEQLSLFKASQLRENQNNKAATRSEQVENKKQFAELLLSKLDPTQADSALSLNQASSDKSKDPDAALQALLAQKQQEQQQSNQFADLIKKIQDTKL